MSNPSSSAQLSKDSPVTTDVLQATCQDLGIQLKKGEEEDYRQLLATFHHVAEEVMAMEGMSY